MQDTIETLRADLKEYSHAWSNGDISDDDYHRNHQRISKAISKLRESQPSNFNSPISERSEIESAFLSTRFRMLKDYNKRISELRISGIIDQSGHRNYGAENKVRYALTQALSKTDKARSLEVLERIASDTEEKIRLATPFSAAA